jgi:deoxyribose-phosphate aldolase
VLPFRSMRGIELAPFLDYSVLRPSTQQREVDRACDAALLYRFRGLVVPSAAVTHAKRRLVDSGIKVVSVVGFPHGTSAPDIKAHEAMRASAMGADELDYVISIGAALDGDFKFLFEEAVAVIRSTRGKIVKAILETSYMPPDIWTQAARTLVDAGIPYIKTCTGFGPAGTTVGEVATLAAAIQGRALIKASGGVHTADDVVALLQAGAAIVGTSRGPQICGAES